MNIYYDTGLILKLYTQEPESDSVIRFITDKSAPIPFLSIHKSECTAALHQKVFRREYLLADANRALSDIDEDQRKGILKPLSPEWEYTWNKTIELSCSHASQIGSRTLDTLHVAAALELGFREFASSDGRQKELARRTGLTVHDPTNTHK
ncbi:MAG: type II toxin-antitoxin system VapC family toxin [Opitutales bacterium]|nr:type II toxin-antitoxin system VapC family toxin [Opitutales bacterium]